MDNYLPTETKFVYPSPATVLTSPTSLTTSWVSLQIRADESSSSSSTKKTTTTSKCTDAQKCQTGQGTNGLTIGLSVAIPCAVFLMIIGYFLFRSYKKGKLEAKDDNDPDFYGETTILPDYPKPGAYNTGTDDNSLYSAGQNPFATENTRYPSAAIQNHTQPRNFSRGAPSMQSEQYYESFSLPYQHTMGSKQSLDQYAKGIGSEYQAYQVSSQPASRPQSPYRSANSSATNLNHQNDSKMRNLTEKSTNSYEGETTDSPYSFDETKANHEDDIPRRREDDVFTDPGQIHNYEDEEEKRYSDVSYLEDEPEQLNTSHDMNTTHDTTVIRRGIPDEEIEEEVPQTKKGVSFDAKDDEDDDEDIKRMKSVYNVYFDRENSVKRPGKAVAAASLQDAPPLPSVGIDTGDEEQDEIRELQEAPQTGYLSTEQPKKHRVVSSVYSTVPLQFDQHAPQQLDPSYQPQQQYAEYPPQQQYQNYPPQQQYQNYPPQQQQHYPPQPPSNVYQPQSRYGSPSASPRLQPQHSGRPVDLPPLQTVPTPNKIEYADVVTSTEYAPTKSLTGGTRPPDIQVRPFNPLHYSDQIFSPTSPVSSPSTGQFLPPDAQMRDQLPPSPHHLRQSIVMVDPVGIGKEKIYRPAGSFSQMNSANSSRAGSLTSQSAYAPPQQNDGEFLPRSGSKADLRTQLGSSENYNFV